MSAQHTPEPWEADAAEMAEGIDEIFTVSIWGAGSDGDRTHVAIVSAFQLISEMKGGVEFVTSGNPEQDALDEAKANARLIAAAPDLLAALASFLRAPSVGSNGPGSSTIVVQEFNLRAARAAVAKATGAAT